MADFSTLKDEILACCVLSPTQAAAQFHWWSYSPRLKPRAQMDTQMEAQFISTLDLRKAYWQVAIMPSAKKKMACSMSSGNWHYQVLYFGLHGAPATFHDGYCPKTWQEICICFLDQRHHTLHSPVPSKGGAVRTPMSWAGCQPKEAPPRANRHTVPGIQVGRGLHQTHTKRKRWKWSKHTPHLLQKTGMCLLLPKFCDWIHLASLPLANLTRKAALKQIKWTAAAKSAFQQL